MKKTNKLDVWMISRVSVFLNQSISGTQGNCIYWFLNDGSEVLINFDDKKIGFVDWVGDDKTYYSIVGVACTAGFTTGDYFTEK
jgi:hypothetical protein